MIRAIALAAVMLSGAGCGGRDDRDPPRQAQTEVRPVAPADAAPPARDAAEPTLRQHMGEHFRAVSELERAIVRGQLDVARARAQYLVDHDEHPGLDGWAPYVLAMRAAARQVVAAPDLPTAGLLAADLGLQCSRCHTARRAAVAFGWQPVIADDDSLATQMRRHQWAAARLWEGLVGPSDDLWTEGARVLASNRLDAVAAAGATAPDAARDLAGRVRALARKAGTVTSPEGRAALYGELLAVCTTCHQVTRDRDRGPVPPAQ